MFESDAIHTDFPELSQLKTTVKYILMYVVKKGRYQMLKRTENNLFNFKQVPTCVYIVRGLPVFRIHIITLIEPHERMFIFLIAETIVNEKIVDIRC